MFDKILEEFLLEKRLDLKKIWNIPLTVFHHLRGEFQFQS